MFLKNFLFTANLLRNDSEINFLLENFQLIPFFGNLKLFFSKIYFYCNFLQTFVPKFPLYARLKKNIENYSNISFLQKIFSNISFLHKLFHKISSFLLITHYFFKIYFWIFFFNFLFTPKFWKNLLFENVFILLKMYFLKNFFQNLFYKDFLKN